MTQEHTYSATVTWTGNCGDGTSGYKAYTRDHDIACPGKPVLQGSADPAYRGDAARHNPEDMLVAALSACHMLWYLHLCSTAGVVVTAYEDAAEGIMQTHPPDGTGEFTRVTLRPSVTITARKRCRGCGTPARNGQRQLLRRPLRQLSSGSRAENPECVGHCTTHRSARRQSRPQRVMVRNRRDRTAEETNNERLRGVRVIRRTRSRGAREGWQGQRDRGAGRSHCARGAAQPRHQRSSHGALRPRCAGHRGGLAGRAVHRRAVSAQGSGLGACRRQDRAGQPLLRRPAARDRRQPPRHTAQASRHGDLRQDE